MPVKPPVSAALARDALFRSRALLAFKLLFFSVGGGAALTLLLLGEIRGVWVTPAVVGLGTACGLVALASSVLGLHALLTKTLVPKPHHSALVIALVPVGCGLVLATLAGAWVSGILLGD